MKIQITPLFSVALGVILAAGLAPTSFGQAIADVASQAQPLPAQTGTSATTITPVVFKTLYQSKFNLSNRSVFFNIVEPPVLPIRPAPTPPPEPVLTPAEQQAELLREQKEWKSLCFSATVYNHRITEITWGNQGQYRVYSNIDFCHFSHLMEVETDTTVFSVFYFLFDQTWEAEPDIAARLPASSTFPQGTFSYIVDNTCTPPLAEDLAWLNAIHSYYTANSTQLAADYQKRVIEWQSQELWKKTHPPVPQNTVMNFWPIKGSAYLPATSGTNQ